MLGKRGHRDHRDTPGTPPGSRAPTLAMAVAQLSPASSISWSTLNLYSVKSSWSMAWASSCLGERTAALGASKHGTGTETRDRPQVWGLRGSCRPLRFAKCQRVWEEAESSTPH